MTERPRVLQVVTHLALGGAESVAATLQRTLRSECDFGLFAVHGQSGDPVGLAFERETRELGVPLFTGTRVPFKAGGVWFAAAALARAVRKFRPDVIHLHAEHAELTAAVWLRGFAMRQNRPPIVRTIHNSVFWRSWPRIGRWCERQLGSAVVACVSAAARDEFLRHRLAAVAGEPPVAPMTIYNGVDVQLRSPRARPLEAGIVRMLFAGRFEPQKGADVLCRALPSVQLPSGTEGELVLVGRGRLAPQIEQLAASPPKGWLVQIQPPTADLPRLMETFDLFVAPSRFEGIGLAAIEAICVGLPVVATTAAGLCEALPPDHPWMARVDDVADLAAHLSDAIRRTDTWATSGARAQAFARRRFAPETMAQAYSALYHQAALSS